VTLQLAHEPEGIVERVGEAVGAVKARIKRDMANFKEYIETRGVAEGSWRGEVAPKPQRNRNA
jgi:hypothetical protein